MSFKSLRSQQQKPATPDAREKPKSAQSEALSLTESEWEQKLRKIEENIIDKLTETIKQTDERMHQRFSEMTAEIVNLKVMCRQMEKRINVLEADKWENKNLVDEVTTLKAEISRMQNETVCTDVILNGIPHQKNENVAEIFHKICSIININGLAVKNSFRILSKGTQHKNKPSPIIIKLNSAYDRNQLFRAFAKANKRSLTLSDIGESSDSKIYIHESLSKINRDLINYATQKKRQKLLWSVYSKRGIVYAKQKQNSEAKQVTSITEIDALASTI